MPGRFALSDGVRRVVEQPRTGSRALRAGIAGAAAAAVVFSMFAGVPASAYENGVVVERIAGADRYATAVAISQRFVAPVDTVYVATGQNFPDALSAAPAAAAAGGPLLLTPTATLPQVVKAEIQRLQPRLIVVAGGAGAVSADVYTQLSGLATEIRRDAGANRYETSRVISERAFPVGSAVRPFLATGANFPDALSASAAAGSTSDPVILVHGSASTLDAATVSLLDEYVIEGVVIVGGPAVVSPGIESSARTKFGTGNVERISGADRYTTSSAILSRFSPTASSVFVAVGTNFADALAGATLAGATSTPLVVSRGDCVPATTLDAISTAGVSTVTLLGGVGALGRAVAAGTECFDVAPVRGDGDRIVGTGIKPGTYYTSGGESCYWERVSSFDGSFDSIIANDFGDGPRIVTIDPTDYGFSSERCGTWDAVQKAPALSAPRGDGISAVTLQFDPGTYRATNPNGNCYWATLSGFSGEFDDLLANDFVSAPGPVVVDIGPQVEGFESARCGIWTRIG